MTLKEFFEQFRSDVDDLKTPYLWSDEDMERYLNWALEELATVAWYFYDMTTWASLTVTADDPKIAATTSNKLSRILRIRRAILGSSGRKLGIKTMSQADQSDQEDDYGQRLYDVSSGWETQSGTPDLIVQDYYDDGSLRIGPVPSVADTISLWAYRLPLEQISFSKSEKVELSELVGVREHNHELTLLEGMKARAYLKEDPETRDTELAAQALLRFQIETLEIKNELKRRRQPTGKVRYGGI